jgi:hypothetical protein
MVGIMTNLMLHAEAKTGSIRAPMRRQAGRQGG